MGIRFLFVVVLFIVEFFVLVFQNFEVLNVVL